MRSHLLLDPGPGGRGWAGQPSAAPRSVSRAPPGCTWAPTSPSPPSPSGASARCGPWRGTARPSTGAPCPPPSRPVSAAALERGRLRPPLPVHQRHVAKQPGHPLWAQPGPEAPPTPQLRVTIPASCQGTGGGTLGALRVLPTRVQACGPLLGFPCSALSEVATPLGRRVLDLIDVWTVAGPARVAPGWTDKEAAAGAPALPPGASGGTAAAGLALAPMLGWAPCVPGCETGPPAHYLEPTPASLFWALRVARVVAVRRAWLVHPHPPWELRKRPGVPQHLGSRVQGPQAHPRPTSPCRRLLVPHPVSCQAEAEAGVCGPDVRVRRG